MTEAPADLLAWSLPGEVQVRCTGRGSGSFADPAGRDGELDALRRQVVALPWTWVRQTHSDHVLVVERPGHGAGSVADAVVSTQRGAALSVLTADCAPVALASPEGAFGVVHAGWRGLLNGVLERAVEAVRELGATDVVAVLGPCIRPECYRFGAEDLDAVASRLGESVRGRDRHGEAALDIPAGVRAALERAGARLVADCAICTACSEQHWSWRARRDCGRQAMVAWR